MRQQMEEMFKWKNQQGLGKDKNPHPIFIKYERRLHSLFPIWHDYQQNTVGKLDGGWYS